MTELGQFSKSSVQLERVVPRTFQKMVEREEAYSLMVSVIEFNQEPGNDLIRREYLGFPQTRNEQKVMLNLIRYEYESYDYTWIEHNESLYRSFEVMNYSQSIAIVTAFKAKEGDTE